MQLTKRLMAIAMAVCLSSLTSGIAYCCQNEGKIVVPKSTIFTLELLSPISTATNKKGDTFDCKILAPEEFSGAIVSGHLTKCKGSGNVKGDSELAMAFDTIAMGGREGKFHAQIQEVYELVGAKDQGRADPEGVVGGGTRRKNDALKISIGAAIGAIVGGIIAGGKGAAVGSIIGAGAGVASILKTKGPNLEFKDGTQFTVRT